MLAGPSPCPNLGGWAELQPEGQHQVVEESDFEVILSPEDSEVKEIYNTDLGKMYQATVEEFLDSPHAKRLKGKVQLIFTSPPFPLLTPKNYGNLVGKEYLKWLSDLAPKLRKLLTPDGSIVIELGNAWERGQPVMSTLPLEALLKFQKAGELYVNQQFICNNPARLPSPIQWVNIDRIRVKDSFTHVWWMSPTQRPKADNRKVLVPYSESMKKLIKTQKYNSGMRPSGHNIGETSFLTDNGGAIPASVLSYTNTRAGTPYRNYCRDNGIAAHPAPMQLELAEFFVKMLTDQGDLVFDPFGGSNTTGAASEELGRRWITTEPRDDYVRGSKGRFERFRSEPPEEGQAQGDTPPHTGSLEVE